MKPLRTLRYAALLGIAGLGIVSQAHGGAAAPQRGVQDVTPTTAPVAVSPIGPYYALVIGNNNYQHLRPLQTAVNDAKDVAQLFQDRFGFQTRVLYDATRAEILEAIDSYRELPESSNLVIYYAGHGWKDKDARRAYWLPVDADAHQRPNWINSTDITDGIRAIKSRHVLVIADSCFSGDLTIRSAGGVITSREHNAIVAKMLSMKSRHIMSSGSDEPVSDAGTNNHSVFAAALLQSLVDMEDDTFTAEALLSQRVKPRVAGRSLQTPQYAMLRDSDADLGDFVFFRRQKTLSIFRHKTLSEMLKDWGAEDDSAQVVSQPPTTLPAAPRTHTRWPGASSNDSLDDLLKDFSQHNDFADMLWLGERRGEILRRSKTIYVDAEKLGAAGIPVAESDLRSALLKDPNFSSLNLQLVYDRRTADLVLGVETNRLSGKRPANRLYTETDDLVLDLNVASRAFPVSLLKLKDRNFASKTVSVVRTSFLLVETDVLASEIVSFLRETRAAPWPDKK